MMAGLEMGIVSLILASMVLEGDSLSRLAKEYSMRFGGWPSEQSAVLAVVVGIRMRY